MSQLVRTPERENPNEIATYFTAQSRLLGFSVDTQQYRIALFCCILSRHSAQLRV